MSRRFLKLACTGMSILLSPSALAQEELPLDRFHAAYEQAMIDGRTERILPFYSDKVRVMPEYHGTLFGAANARVYFDAFLERFDVRGYEREQLKVLDLGARVVDSGRFKMTLASRTGTHELTGKYTEVWRTTNGESALLAQTWNYDSYPAIANELRFEKVPGVRIAFEPHVPIKDPLSFELAALNKLQEAAIKEKDADLWARFYADDALLLTNHGLAYEGRSAIDKYIDDHAIELPIFEKLDIRHDEMDSIGTHVIDYASHIAVWRNGDSSGVNTGKNIRIWRREPHGGLKIIVQIGTYD